LIQQQAMKLYAEIQQACKAARERKAALRMLLEAEELQSYLRCAFDHFGQTLSEPFDFVKASFFNNPRTLNFGENILKLVKIMAEQEEKKKKNPDARIDPRAMFSKLSPMLASCIMADSVRNKVKGKKPQRMQIRNLLTRSQVLPIAFSLSTRNT
jgi:hypothetical protein